MLQPSYEQRLYLRRYSRSDEVIMGCANQAGEVLRGLGLPDDAAREPHGESIALGHPLDMSGATLVLTALHQRSRSIGSDGGS